MSNSDLLKNIRGYDILIFTYFPWDNPYSSVSFSFAKEFIKNNRVFYVNPPYSYKDVVRLKDEPMTKKRMPAFLKNKMQYEKIEAYPNIIAAQPPLTIPINWLNNRTMYNRLHQHNEKKVIKTMEKVIRDNDIKDYIFLNCYYPFYLGTLPKALQPAINIYQCIDDISGNDYTVKHGKRLEDEAIAKADITLVTSTELHRLKSQISPNTYILHNAADIAIFNKAREVKYDRPAEIKDITGKIIGFTGNMDADRVDYQLLKKIAEHHTDKTLLLVGPLNNTEYKEIGLDKMPNVIFTGSKNITVLPQYLQYMDCTLIPFKKNLVTKSIYPLKINEYLAAGKAVVARDFSNDIKSFGDDIYIGENHEEIINLVDKAINENSDERIAQRVAVAQTNTWTARVAQFWDIVEDFLSKPKNENETLVLKK